MTSSNRQRKSVYQKQRWKDAREKIIIEQRGLCYICKTRPIEIVHHKNHLTESNYETYEIAFDMDNLIGVCRECHGREHSNKQTVDGLTFDSQGNIIRV